MEDKLPLRELRTQHSLRRTLQRWRSMHWLSRGPGDINLDESQSLGLLGGAQDRLAACGTSLWRRRSPACGLGLVILAALLAVVGVLLTDLARLMPCMRPDSPCFNLALAEFQDICNFERMPVRLTTTAYLPPLYSRLHVRSAVIDVALRGEGGLRPVARSSFGEGDAISSMVLTGGPQNMTVNTMMDVSNSTGLALMFAYLLNEVDFQVAIMAQIQVSVQTPLRFSIKTPIRSNFFLTCGHLPCRAAACKYICQFGDYPLKDPDPNTPYPYVTRVEKVGLGYDAAGQYIISPQVNVWLRNFKAAAAFPPSIVDLYFYNATKPGQHSGFRDRADLDEDHKLFQVSLQEFMLQSVETSGGKPFTMNMDLRLYNDTPGQASTARDFTTRFLGKEPMYLYLAGTSMDKTCPQLRAPLLLVPPAGMSLNTNFSTKDGSDSSLSSMGALTDVFRVNAVDLFSLNNTILRSFVNITLMLPFALEGELPSLDMDGFAGPDLMGHFKSFPVTLPDVPPRQGEESWKPPPHSFGKEAALSSSISMPKGEATLVLFTEAQLSDWGVTRLQTIFPDFLTQLEELDIDLVGSRPQEPGNVMQTFLNGVVIKLASLEDRLVQHGTSAGRGRLFFTPADSPVKPRVHVEVKSISYEHSRDTGLLAYVNFTLPDAFQGRFAVRGGSMHFLLANDNSTALATVTVLDMILSGELTHVEAEVFISDSTQAKAVHDLVATYTEGLPSGVRILDGVVDTVPGLKQQVPVNFQEVQEHCDEDIAAHCPGMDPVATRACLNKALSGRILTHHCLRVLLPRGALDVVIPDLSKVVDLGRGIANGFLDDVKSTASKVAVNLVELLSLSTPAAPMDLQVILEEDKRRMATPDGTPVEVRARANLSVGLFESIDLTFVVPPLAVEILTPLALDPDAGDADGPVEGRVGADKAAAAGESETSLFTVALPAMDKEDAASPLLLVDSAVRIQDIYKAMFWFEDIMADLTDKYVVAHPVSTGDVWSYMMEPLRLKIDILAAINSTALAEEEQGKTTTTGNGGGTPAAILKQNANETWSKILFRAASFPDLIVTETQLAFSRPWSEAVDVRIPPMGMSVYTSFVEAADGLRAPLLTNGTSCVADARACPLGDFKAGTFRTTRGSMVVVNTNLNMTAEDGGRFWGHILSDYVAGARVGLWLKTEANAAAEGLFDMDAAIILPKMPPLNIPLNDLVTRVEEVSRRALREGRRQLSLAEIWASLDPIILSVTQPVSIKVDTVKLQNFESNPVDPMDVSSIALGADLVARSVVTIPDILQVDLQIPPLSMLVFNENLSDLALPPPPPPTQGAAAPSLASSPVPLASANVSEFLYDSQRGNTSTVELHVDILRVKKALQLAEAALIGGQNVSLTVVGAPGESTSLFSRIFAHMKVQLDMVSSPSPLDGDTNDGGSSGSMGGARPDKPASNKASKTMERLSMTARVSSTASGLVVDADVFVPQHGNPLVMTLLAGAMDLKVVLKDVPEAPDPLAFIALAPLVLSQERDMHVDAKVLIEPAGVRTMRVLVARIKARQTTEVQLAGTVANAPIGRFKTSIMLTPALMDKLGLFEDEGESLLKFSLDELLQNPRTPFRVDNVGIVGGKDGVGSPVSLPCLLKGWCDGGVGPGGLGGATATDLRALVSATVTRLSSFLGLPDGFLALTFDLPRLVFQVAVDPTSHALGTVVVEPTQLVLRDGSPVSLAASAHFTDAYGLQGTVFSLWERPFTVSLVGGTGDGQGDDVLASLLRLLPISVKVSAPPPGTAGYVDSLRTLPTFCDGRWTIEKTTASGFVARIDLPTLTSPLPITMEQFTATILYRGVPILQGSTVDGTFHVGPEGATRHLSLATLTTPPGAGGEACAYPTSAAELCLLGEALGKLMTFGDSGPFVGEMLITYQNPAKPEAMQSIRMPIQVYADGVGGGNGAQQRFPRLWGWPDYTPPAPKPKAGLTCAAAHELVQDIYINLEDTVGASMHFWDTVEVAMKVFMVNVFAFPLDVSHLRLTMFFRDPDGVPDSRPSLVSYPPSYDYCLLYKVDLPTPGLVIPPGKGQWTPLLRPRMDEQKLMESLARLFDEVVVHKRLCADILDSVIGVTIRPNTPSANDVPFFINLPVSIRSIPFYSTDACGVTPVSAAGTKALKDAQKEGQAQTQAREQALERAFLEAQSVPFPERAGGSQEATAIAPDGRVLHVSTDEKKPREDPGPSRRRMRNYE